MAVIILSPYPSIKAANNQRCGTSAKKHNKDYRSYQRTCDVSSDLSPLRCWFPSIGFACNNDELFFVISNPTFKSFFMSELCTGFTVVLEQPDFFVVNKEAGIDMHDDAGVPGLVSRVSAFWGQNVYPVHRLDKVTSGLVLLAKNKEATSALSQAFADRCVKKTYLAISDRTPKKKQGWVKGDMAKGRNGSWKLLHSSDNPAITYFQSVSLAIPHHRLYIVSPHTGKTHQIRVALKSISAPILGDERYGGTVADRTYLHAWRLQFSYAGAEYSVEVDPEWGEKIDCKLHLQNFIP